MKVGLLGGSFNPIHNGHIHIAKSALDALNLDKVLLIPNKNAPYKKKDKLISDYHKLELCKVVENKYEFIEVCDIELKQDKFSYTYDTIKKLVETYTDDELYFIMGADTLFKFSKWRSVKDICKLVQIIVVTRNGIDMQNLKDKANELSNRYGAKIHLVEADLLDVSSTDIRSGVNLDKILPEIKEYILKNNLYGW